MYSPQSASEINRTEHKSNARRIYIFSLLGGLTVIFYLNYINQSIGFGGLSFVGKAKPGISPIDQEAPWDEADGHPIVPTFTTKPEMSSVVGAVPTAVEHEDNDYWYAHMNRQGIVAFNTNPQTYEVFRNVKSFGAKGDGIADDTQAINAAISYQPRCGQGCDSSTTQPAIVYFPPGTYKVSTPIIAMYYTQLVGNPINLPIIKAARNFNGIAVIDSDPYLPGGANWYQNQNNFFRAIRNFVIDLREMDPGGGTGIHWQVAQATSLYNMRFEMHTSPGNGQQGIFMDNGSGGFMSSLTFNGGKFGAFFGNQQFTTLNLTFNNCQTAIYMNWNWVWLLKSMHIHNCQVGLDIGAGGPDGQAVGSVVLLDSEITDTPRAVVTVKSASSLPRSGGTLVIDNVKLTNVPVMVTTPEGHTILEGTPTFDVIKLWGQGKGYSSDRTGGDDLGDDLDTITKSKQFTKITSLLDDTGHFLERQRPLYEHLTADRFVSVRDEGAKGDGRTDDTAAIQRTLKKYAGQTDPATRKIIYFDHGHYVITSTILVMPDTYIVGECWSTIISSGQNFANHANPAPVFMVGQSGNVGRVEMSDLVFETRGPAGGAILMQWNLRDPDFNKHEVSGMWDVHFRVGGSAGTNLQSDVHTKRPGESNFPSITDVASQAAFMLLHIGKTASLYMENSWLWTADHELDLADHNQITIYSGRGVYCEAEQGPVWLYGTASEHNVMYQYQFHKASNVFMGVIQTETAYYQSNPTALMPYPRNDTWNDPDFIKSCDGEGNICLKGWGLRIVDSKDIYMYGGGLYSFFENYSTDPIKTNKCQKRMISVEGGEHIWLFATNTIGTEVMVVVSGGEALDVRADGHANNFASTVGLIMVP